MSRLAYIMIRSVVGARQRGQSRVGARQKLPRLLATQASISVSDRNHEVRGLYFCGVLWLSVDTWLDSRVCLALARRQNSHLDLSTQVLYMHLVQLRSKHGQG